MARTRLGFKNTNKIQNEVLDVNMPFRCLYFTPNFAFHFLILVLRVVNQIILLAVL